MVLLSHSLISVIACPRRYHLERVARETVPAPFATSFLGQRVHRRIALSLERGEPASTRPFRLPRRLLFREGDDVEALLQRATDGLDFFNRKCRPWLEQHTLLHTERFIKAPLHGHGVPVLVGGKLDAIFRTRRGELIIDWKTGALVQATEQLRFYLALRRLETGREPLRAEAVSLSTGESEVVAWEEETGVWFRKHVAEMAERLEQAQHHSSRLLLPGPHCGYCPYAHTCEASEATPRRVLDTHTGEVQALASPTRARERWPNHA